MFPFVFKGYIDDKDTDVTPTLTSVTVCSVIPLDISPSAPGRTCVV